MNCKPGDLAVIVRGHNIGKLVECLRPDPEYAGDWIIRPLYRATHNANGSRIVPGLLFSAADSALRPIRDNDGKDETLTWAGKPEGVAA